MTVFMCNIYHVDLSVSNFINIVFLLFFNAEEDDEDLYDYAVLELDSTRLMFRGGSGLC